MDCAFHALTALAVSKELTGKYLLSASLFSILPDFIGATPYELKKIQHSSKRSLKGFSADFKKLTRNGTFFSSFDKAAYRAAHSWLSLIPVSLIALAFCGKLWWVLTISYFSHLLVDVFTHEKEFSQRPLYPFFDWHITGKSWENKNVFLGFWFILLTVLFLQRIRM